MEKETRRRTESRKIKFAEAQKASRGIEDAPALFLFGSGMM
jgi:hypothetical protein